MGPFYRRQSFKVVCYCITGKKKLETSLIKEMVRLKSRNVKNYKLPEINCLWNCNLYLSSLLFWICLCYHV